ncbi:MAG: hypothetical protein ACODAD_08150 [Planctomycetota bacterium]
MKNVFSLLKSQPSGPSSLSGADPLGEDSRRASLRSHRFPAWLLSLILHAGLLISLGFMLRVAERGGQLQPARGGGIVLARDVDGKAEYFGEEAASRDQSAQSPDASTSMDTVLPDSKVLPVDLAGTLPDSSSAPSGIESGLSLPSAEGIAQEGKPPNRGDITGNEAKTSVFGAEGVGSKFVYVFDRSASMDGYQGRPLKAAKRELNASLADLEQVHQFQIVFYNDGVTVFNPSHPRSPRMLFGDTPTKRQARDFVRGVIATGGTKHVPALKLALGMTPDVVFFLTDAGEPQLSPTQLADIHRANRRVGAAIHAIEFGEGANQRQRPFLQRLAEQNGGTYVYIDVTRLEIN